MGHGHVSISSASELSNLHAWLISVDNDMLLYEDWLVRRKYFNPLRLKLFDPVDLESDKRTHFPLCDKKMLVAAIASLPDTVNWPR